MSITVKCIDVYGIKERLRVENTKNSKDALTLIKLLEETLKRQQELTALAIKKLREK